MSFISQSKQSRDQTQRVMGRSREQLAKPLYSKMDHTGKARKARKLQQTKHREMRDLQTRRPEEHSKNTPR